MIAGRFQWLDAGTPAKKPTRNTLAIFEFDVGKLVLTEAGTKKRASLYVVQGDTALAEHDPGGLEVMDADFAAFDTALRRENRTLKRALTDPRILSGIGNAYSDEILHAARLSPVTLTSRLDDEQMQRLYDATRDTLGLWLDRLLDEASKGFPKKVTAFRPEMAVHGRYGMPCPVCDTNVQRIRYAGSETNYCPNCQTGGKLLADRALSRLLKKDWPRTVDELEKIRPGGKL
jgi:formamidopyrimidine-DNA glycosylase